MESTEQPEVSDTVTYYEDNFTPNGYRKFMLEILGGLHPSSEAHKFFYRSAMEFKKEPGFCGETLLDIGSGPTAFAVSAVASEFKSIIMSELVTSCREELQKWIDNAPDALDWSPVYQYAAKFQGYNNVEDGALAISTMLRKRIKAIIPCNILSEEIVDAEYGAPYDAISCSLVIENAAPDIQTFGKILKRLNRLVKLDGSMMLKGFLNSQKGWPCGGKTFRYLSVTQSDLEDALLNAGFENILWKLIPGKSGEYMAFEYGYVLVCSKLRTIE